MSNCGCQENIKEPIKHGPIITSTTYRLSKLLELFKLCKFVNEK